MSIKISLDNIINFCENHKLKLTLQQELIVNIIINSKKPLTQNDILFELKKTNPKANRMTIYRSLDILSQHHIIHNVNFDNTYLLCNHLDEVHSHQILVCKICGNRIEIKSNNLEEIISAEAKKFGFIASPDIEISGSCKNCTQNIA